MNMKRLSASGNRIVPVLTIVFFASVILGMTEKYIPHLDSLAATMYCVFLILWGFTIRIRITDANIRRRILVICVFMLTLFVLRVGRFNFFDESVNIAIMLWYAYYIPMTAVPVFGLCAALYVEPVSDIGRVKRTESVLYICETIICVLILTNPLHEQIFKMLDPATETYRRGWMYLVLVIWIVALGISIPVILLRKCVLSSIRRLWYIPAICIGVSLVPITVYYAGGGPPVIGPFKLFHMHEAFCLPFVVAFEILIQLRLIPANSGYEQLFDRSGINACIYDHEGREVLSSSGWNIGSVDDDHVMRKKEISGGYVTWIENHSAINALNREYEEITDELEDENELIRHENEIRAERTSYETKNRLYNKIASAVRDQAGKCDELLSDLSGNEDSKDKLILATVLSAYIKRMGNLMLITDESLLISSDELALCIRESMEYMDYGNISCGLINDTEAELPRDYILSAYRLFEEMIENTWGRLHSCEVLMKSAHEFGVTIALDVRPDINITSFENSGLTSLTVREEDDTYYIEYQCRMDKFPSGEVNA
ncbi:MAG: hypothetical protein K6F54_05055 [Lachnospiraceae bacterium]|nr:hypothetical protein [Lachnospiraceae bacterium]